MKIYQYFSEGKTLVAADDGRGLSVVGGVASPLTLVRRAASENDLAAAVARAWRQYGRKKLPRRARGPLLPLRPPEVWGFGVTYRKSAEDRADDAPTAADIYRRAHQGPRPEIFFKATGARCVGPEEPIGIRGDSALTAPEAELAYVVGRGGAVVAYTLANDVSAWDIERDNPLYLPQSKIYKGCCALGPALVTADEVRPDNVEIKMTITRGGEVIFAGAARTADMRYDVSYLHSYLTRYNDVPPGTVALTGTGIMLPPGLGLAAGDLVAIEAAGFGRLRNPAVVLPYVALPPNP